MRFQLTLVPETASSLMPINYQYPLSAVIYKLIQQADESYASFLHNNGYRLPTGKSFKLFTFSDLRVPFQIKGDRLQLSDAPASLIIGFHMEEAATHFIRGLFINQQIEIADHASRVKFSIQEATLLPDPISRLHNEEPEITLQPLSPLVTGRKNERGNYDFLSPADPDFVKHLKYGWMEKFRSLNSIENIETSDLSENISIQLITPGHQIKSRLISIKANTSAATQVRGFTRFRLKVRAPKLMLELALNAGLGLYNAMGMGCVEAV